MSALRVGLFGFGRTGQLVAREILDDPSIELAWVVRRTRDETAGWASRSLGLARDEGPLKSLDRFGHELGKGLLRPVDVVVDFSSTTGAQSYAALAELGTRIVSAISHYDEAGHSLLQRMAEKTAVLHSPNITVGVNFLMVAAKALRRLAPEADVAVVEEHFRNKSEISGTAVRLAQALEMPPEATVHSVRAGGIVGRHEVIFGLPNQTVRLVHESISRAAFGRGALFAARWLQGRNLGLYSMEDAVREAMLAAAAG
jgi:4-hydroxy-tetrahydrodipicolinate reductase